MQLVHFTDLHFGCEDTHALTAATKYVRDLKPDAVIVTGDISKDGLQSELSDACDWIRSLEAPAMLTPGNHDVPYYEMWGRLFYPWDRIRRAQKGIRHEAWHTDEWSIVPVNTARAWQFRLNWAQGEISRGQTAVAAAELQRAKPGALRIIISHHPLDWPNDAPIKGVTRGGLRGLRKLADAGAELFLSGHLHFASARLFETRALSVTSGTLSQRVRHEPCAFTVIRRPAPKTIETEVVHINQGVCETASVRRFQLDAPQEPGESAEVHAETSSATMHAHDDN